MNEDLITKRELLEKYGISYGALYRWKRMGLIPEEWFIKRAVSTGQETYFDRATITERIDTIIKLKDSMSLEEIAVQLGAQNGMQRRSGVQLKLVWRSGERTVALEELEGVFLIDPQGETTDITEMIKNNHREPNLKNGSFFRR